jgi:hypothetical protein
MDRFECYELCVQSPRHVAQLLRDVFARGGSGATPAVLREDFCGTAALSRRWVRDGLAAGIRARAVGVDLDSGTLEHARREAERADTLGMIEMRLQDAVGASVAPGDGCDVIFVGNFSIGYIHERALLVEYLRRSRERIGLGNGGFGGGVFVCDIYDSPRRFDLGCVHRRHPSRGKEIIHYTWEHREADVLTGMVENAIHFRVEVDGVIEQEMFDAFVYRWRLWSLTELRDAMHEAGFDRVEVFAEVANGAKPIESGKEMPESGVVCVAAWA